MEPEPVIATRPFQWRGSLVQQLADAGYALSCFARPLAGGQVWQRWAHRLITVTGAGQVQGPGSQHLFGFPSASGIAHEVDAAGILDVPVVLEAKDQGAGISKVEVDAFDGRTFDYFEAAVQRGWTSPLYRVMWSTMPVDSYVRRYAARRGIIMVAPDCVPLPTLLAAAERWDAVDWLQDRYLAELVTLGERACRPLYARPSQQGLVYEYELEMWKGSDLADLDYIHDLAASQWLDWLDRAEPLYFEHSAQEYLQRICGWRERTA